MGLEPGSAQFQFVFLNLELRDEVQARWVWSQKFGGNQHFLEQVRARLELVSGGGYQTSQGPWTLREVLGLVLGEERGLVKM